MVAVDYNDLSREELLEKVFELGMKFRRLETSFDEYVKATSESQHSLDVNFAACRRANHWLSAFVLGVFLLMIGAYLYRELGPLAKEIREIRQPPRPRKVKKKKV
mmetsp:Transcript_24208/g.34660  ORF Transcript_24208/g.34660 Transcript_24208/m.34660 type:complete len:105 (+) Transcript_24208:95-409(+)|eukprot:CAMPEP_0202458346 /NCGR_PEP_ID=MMETSP1360-20130828/24487_1 /ASSEMBLY_ACC=CAM_ASM_000848 /TAXON_ID=515479 /ORGANISM="Licmophora paradoxa, Strain CCMP2313" /LENGTH=104 /DNA_ID=CAMNT_0049078855 /DNA_START=48 /DNA_END=365 /DNA_ORIENTATION=-